MDEYISPTARGWYAGLGWRDDAGVWLSGAAGRGGKSPNTIFERHGNQQIFNNKGEPKN